MKRNLLLAFYLLAGIVVGALIAALCAGVPVLSWLSFSRSIGFNPEAPFVLDLSVLRLSFGFSMSISVAHIFTIGAAIFAYNKTRIR